MISLPYLKQWWISRVGTFTRTKGRWFWYQERYNHIKTSSGIEVTYSFHKIVSARWLFQLYRRNDKWDFLTLPDDTKFLIGRSESNIYRSGLDFLEYLETMKGPAILVISTPWEGDPLYEYFMQHDCDKAFVAFDNKREQMLFKLAHT